MQYTIRHMFTSPTMYLVDNFLSLEECDHLINQSTPRLADSTVINLDDGSANINDYRTSKTMFFNPQEDIIIKGIEERIAHLTGFPIENGENIQIVKYGLGEQYKPHYDYFDPAYKGNLIHLNRGGQRMMTVLMFLNDVSYGGETAFPNLSIKVTPRKGMALVWWNCFTDGSVDSNTMHSGEPVLAGEKWIATKWLHERTY